MHELPITRRQREILGLLCAGRTLLQIAEELGISSSTVALHRTKLVIRTRFETLDEVCRHIEPTGSVSRPRNRPNPRSGPPLKSEKQLDDKPTWRRYPTTPGGLEDKGQ